MKVVALVGNPNVGKTTLFNSLTGSNQHIGNWPGVTVERKEGVVSNAIKIVDLPGIYAMDTYSNEEKVSKEFLKTGNADVIINIVDASNLNRNLYLTTQLKEFNIPIILVLNMIDIVEKRNIHIDKERLSKELGVEVLTMSALKNKNTKDIISSIKSGNYKKFNRNIATGFKSEKDAYSFIEDVLSKSVNYKHSSKNSLTKKIDNIVLNKFLSYPIFLAIIFLMFQVTFSWIGAPLQDIVDGFINETFADFVGGLLSNSSPWFSSLIVDGIIGGVGGILPFMPLIITLYLLVSILEDSGYMARIAYIMDKLMRAMGLSGKAFIPMILGFGCTVPAISSTKTLESEKDRKIAALVVPFMSCGARIPIYAAFVPVFFGHAQVVTIISLYLIGILVALMFGMIFKNTVFKKDEEPFIMELPEYKLPSAKNLTLHTWEKAKGFLIKAGTLIFAVSVTVWFLSNFSFTGYLGEDEISQSILAKIGSFFAPIFAPAGFGNWQSAVSLIAGIAAKEVVVATMGVIYGGDLSSALASHFSLMSAYSFMIFVLLYTPCMTALGTMRQEYGTKFALKSALFQFAVALIFSTLIFRIGSLFV